MLSNLMKFRHQIKTSLHYTGLHPEIKRHLSEIVSSLYLIHAALFSTAYSDLEILHFALAPPEHPLCDQEGEGGKG